MRGKGIGRWVRWVGGTRGFEKNLSLGRGTHVKKKKKIGFCFDRF